MKKGATAGLSSSAKWKKREKTLLDKPAVAPKNPKSDFFNRLVEGDKGGRVRSAAAGRAAAGAGGMSVQNEGEM
jgi:hypothetical protein